MNRTAAISLISIALLTGCTASLLQKKTTETQSNEPIRIGYLGPITGDAAGFGADTVNGARMAVEETNAGGGVNGRLVSLIAEDSHCSGTAAASAAEKLIRIDGVSGIIGGGCSSETLASAPIAEQYGVPMISPLSSSPDITYAGDYIFRLYPSDANKGLVLAKYFEQKKHKRIAILSENTDFCVGIRNATERGFTSGASFAFNETVDPGTKEYESVVKKLKATDFDILIANGQSPLTIAAMVKEVRAQGIKQPIISTDAADSLTLGTLARDAVEGLLVLSVPSLTKEDAQCGAFVQTFTEKYGKPEIGYFFAALSYEATKLLLETIRSAGTNGAAIRDALYKSTGTCGVTANARFDEYGDVHGIPFALKEFRGGELVEVERITLE